MLMSMPYSPIDAKLRKNQAGFRTGRSCIKKMHILRRIMDSVYSQNIPLFITLCDFKKAFDSIDRSMMFAILRNYGIPDIIVSAIRVFTTSQHARFPSGKSIGAFRYQHRSATRRCASIISIHHCDGLCLKTISWRIWLHNPQRKHPRQ